MLCSVTSDVLEVEVGVFDAWETDEQSLRGVAVDDVAVHEEVDGVGDAFD